MEIGLLQCIFLIFLSARQHNAVMVHRVPCCLSKLAVHWSETTTGDTLTVRDYLTFLSAQ